MADDQLTELTQFLTPAVPPHIKGTALEYVVGLTATEGGRQTLRKNDKTLNCLRTLFMEDSCPQIVKGSLTGLVNLSSDLSRADQHKLVDSELLLFLLKCVVCKCSKYADNAAMLLSNWTRSESNAKTVLDCIKKEREVSLPSLIDAFCIEKYNDSASLHHIGSFLSNITQLKEARTYILDREQCVIQRILPYTSYMESGIRRAGAVRILRNCSFESDYHEWLLGSDVDIVPYLTLPLAGPEEFPEDEMDQLPLDLQYLPDDKKRDPDPDIRKMLIETLLQFCATKHGREILRSKGVYFVMRELHKVEESESVVTELEKLVQILIGDEPEEGMDNLKEVNIPEKIKMKFEEHDIDQLASKEDNNRS